MTKQQVLDYIEQLNLLGSHPGLESVTELCNRLGNPQDALSFVHIAGTNGKGSVATYIAEIANSAGIKVGKYMSPTLVDYRERIMINGRMITWKDLAVYFEILKKACDGMVADGLSHPTAFEVETALAFLYFKDKGCELVVLECGMGGLLDATNIVTTTIASVITHVGLDHTAILGKTEKEITIQKAGVIKKNCKVVVYPNFESVTSVIFGKAYEMGLCKNDVIVINEDEIKNVKRKLNKQSFNYKKLKGLAVGLNGMHQCLNAAVAVETIDVLNNAGYEIDEAAIKKGLLAAKLTGRLEQIGKKPVFMIDGAHNPQGAQVLRQALDTYFTDCKFTFIIGVFADKDYEKILEIMCDLPQRVITLKTPNNPRALDEVELAAAVMKHCPNVTAAGSVEEAVEMAYLLTPKDEVIAAFGSLSYLGKIKELVEKRKA